jgi:hypothetical protein
MLKSGTIHSITGKMYTYTFAPSCWIFYFKERVVGINKRSYYAHKGHTVQGQGDQFDWVYSDPMVLNTIRQGEAGPFYRRPRVSILTQRRLSGSSPLRSDGSRDSEAGGWSVWTEADSRATFWGRSTESENNSKQPNNAKTVGNR